MWLCTWIFNLATKLFLFSPTIDKPTRFYNNSATLIDNIFVNNPENVVYSGNVVSDISDHFTQFCIASSVKPGFKSFERKIRNYSKFSEIRFQLDMQTNLIIGNDREIDQEFSCFYRKLNKLINKHAPLKVRIKNKA